MDNGSDRDHSPRQTQFDTSTQLETALPVHSILFLKWPILLLFHQRTTAMISRWADSSLKTERAVLGHCGSALETDIDVASPTKRLPSTPLQVPCARTMARQAGLHRLVQQPHWECVKMKQKKKGHPKVALSEAAAISGSRRFPSACHPCRCTASGHRS